MTFSIAARSDDGTHWGVAVASKFLAVGAAVPGVRLGAGAIATQAWANLTYVPRGVELLQQGHGAQEVVDRLIADDDQSADRQVNIVDATGGSASFTGSGCFEWAGGRTGPGYAIAGNILVGEIVVIEMERAWLAGSHLSFTDRLLSVLKAGDDAGGDKRGRQSAAILACTANGGYGGTSDSEMDLRVDDHADPVTELIRLSGIHQLLFGKPEKTVPLEGEYAPRLRAVLDSLGWTSPADSDPDLEAALVACAGVENLEERMVPGELDLVVLEYLENRAAESGIA